jgi:hypothetical protein
MPKATFSANVTYTPGGGGSLTQSFGVGVTYAAISAGTIDIPKAGGKVMIPFGGVDTDACGLVIKNNTSRDIGVRLNASATADAGTDIYHLAPGGIFMHLAPGLVKAGSVALKHAAITAALITTDAAETVDYIVLGN